MSNWKQSIDIYSKGFIQEKQRDGVVAGETCRSRENFFIKDCMVYLDADGHDTVRREVDDAGGEKPIVIEKKMGTNNEVGEFASDRMRKDQSPMVIGS